MAFTRKQFRSIGNRPEAFTLCMFGMQGTRRRLSARIADWLHAAQDPSRAAEVSALHQDALRTAKDLQAEIGVLIAELETPALDITAREVA